MRLRIFITGTTIIAFGVTALQLFEKNLALSFLQGALTLGGSILIAGIFSIKSYWHGVIGAGILALIGFGYGLTNIPDLIAFCRGSAPRGSAPILEFGITLTCLFLVRRVVRALQEERTRRLLLAEQDSSKDS